jgi:hypothetical protein
MSDKIGKYNVSEQEDGTLSVQHESINNKQVNAPEAEPIIVNGVWYLDTLPSHAVVEFEDGRLAKFYITPFRALTDKDFTAYKSYHPRKCKGQPLPDYLYRFYGLKRNDESLSEVIRVRVSPTEKEKLEAYAANLEPKSSVSELLRDYIRGIIK